MPEGGLKSIKYFEKIYSNRNEQSNQFRKGVQMSE